MTIPIDGPAKLANPKLYATGDQYAIWRWMREQAPVHWHPPGRLPGFWSLTRYEDIRVAYRTPRLFSSARGVLLRAALQGDDPGGGLTLALTDPPRHRQLRGLMADWFAERTIRSLDDDIRASARVIVGRALEQGECNFVRDIAARLSFNVLCHILGVAVKDQESLFAWTNDAFHDAASLVRREEIMAFFVNLMYQRMEQPTDDLMSALATGVVDHEFLTEKEVILNCENLLGAIENGQLAMAGGALALLEHPDQWRRLREDRRLLPTAVEEILRWTSSATHSMRTVTEVITIRGHHLKAGDRVVLWLPSANRDESVFRSPDRFDIARQPNRHIAFGAGEHFCIGSTLARAQMTALLSEMLDQVDEIELAGPVVWTQSIAVAGPEFLSVRLSAK